MKTMMMMTVLAALAGCATSTGRRPADAGPERSAPVVEIAPVVDTVLSDAVTATGLLGAKEETLLSFKIGGVIQSVTADVGDVVGQGQVLATLALSEIGAVVAKATAGLEQAERNLARAERLYQDSGSCGGSIG